MKTLHIIIISVLLPIVLLSQNFEKVGGKGEIQRNNKNEIGFFKATANLEAITDKNDFFSSVLNIAKTDEYKFEKKGGSEKERRFEVYRQYYGGVPVKDGVYVLHWENGKLESANGNYIRIGKLDPKPTVTEKEALEIWCNYQKIPASKISRSKIELFVVDLNGTEEIKTESKVVLAYRIRLYSTHIQNWLIGYVDAHTGEICLAEPIALTCAFLDTNTDQNFNPIPLALSPPPPATGTFATRYSGAQSATTESRNNQFFLEDRTRANGIITRNRNNLNAADTTGTTPFADNNNNWTEAEWDNAAKDNAALDVHWTLEQIYDYYLNVHGRRGWDSLGQRTNAYVHALLPIDQYGTLGKDNAAYYDGEYLAFGDGESTFKPLASVDIVAHEYAHGINDHTSDFGLSGIVRSFNEGLSDIWAAAIEGSVAPQKNRWKIGEEVMLTKSCLRNIANPSDPTAESQIARTYGTSEYNSNTGEYYRSGIMSHWFYLLAEGGSKMNGLDYYYTVYGLGIETAARLIYFAQSQRYLNGATTYPLMRTNMVNAANDLFGANSFQSLQVANAWYAVGVGSNPGQVIISGSNSIVGQATYTLQNLPFGLTVEWEPSNSNLSLISEQGTATATFQSDFYGECTINATIKEGGNPIVTLSKTVLADIDLDDLQNVYIDGPDFTCGPTAAFTLRNLPLPSTISWNNQSYTTDSVFIASVSSYSGSPGVAKVTAEIIYRGKPHEVEHAFNFSFNYPGTCYVEDTVMCNNGFYYDSYRDVAGVSVSYLYPASGITYEWSCNNGWTLVSGGTDYAMFEGPPTESNIDVKVCFNNPCGQRTCLVRQLYMPQDLYGLLLTPNPTTFETTVSIGTTSNKSSFGKDEEWSLEVYDARQTLKTKVPRIKGNNTKIQTSGWMEGVYLVRAIWKGRVLTGKLIVKR